MAKACPRGALGSFLPIVNQFAPTEKHAMEKPSICSSLPFRALIIGTLVFVGLPTGLQASLEVNDLVSLDDLVGGPGGLFLMEKLNADPAWSIRTFCAEPAELVFFDRTYLVGGITLMTDTTNKPLTSFAAWLYNSFLDDALTSFNDEVASDVNTLQFAIWKAMEYTKAEITAATKNDTWYDVYDDLLLGKGWEAAYAADGTWSGTGDIYIVNLRTIGPDGGPDGFAQDQFVRMQSPVPEPMSLVIWSSFALVGAIAVRVHRRSTVPRG